MGWCNRFVLPTSSPLSLSVSGSSERDGVSRFVSSSWELPTDGFTKMMLVFVDVFYPGCAHIYDYLGRVKQEIHIYLLSRQFVLTGKQLFTR
ncbi:hypothetical protein HID58_049912 [Brassica napus]|uniref:Uncharacterized protein n=1 Tax=Brassica napus TaxID=3708 RepID=A0ABQ8B6D3_BRANA|nr:hypothetical protein HID58_049912 [Brassica napus]